MNLRQVLKKALIAPDRLEYVIKSRCVKNGTFWAFRDQPRSSMDSWTKNGLGSRIGSRVLWGLLALMAFGELKLCLENKTK